MGAIIVEYGVYGAGLFTLVFSIFVIVYVRPPKEGETESNAEDVNN